MDSTLLTADTFVGTEDGKFLNRTSADVTGEDPLFSDTVVDTPPVAADTPPVTDEPKVDPAEVLKALDNAPSALPEHIQKIKEKYGDDLDTYLNFFLEQKGIDLDTVTTSLTDLQNYRNEQLVERQRDELRKEWGGNFESTFAEVQNYFKNNLSEAEQKAYDNPKGAKMIAALIAQEKQKAGMTTQFNAAPAYQTGMKQSQTNATYKYRQSDVMKMTAKEYEAIAQDFTEAAMRGQVLRDV